MKKSVQALGDYELEQVWGVSYHTIRTLVGCRHPITNPTVRMWQGFETALANYCVRVLEEIDQRNLQDHIEHDLFWAIIVDGPRLDARRGAVVISQRALLWNTPNLHRAGYLPSWFGWKAIHESHRVALQTGDVNMVHWPWERSHGNVRAGVLQGR